MIKKFLKFFSFPKSHPEDYKDQDTNIWDWLATILVLHVPLGGYYWAFVSWELGSWIMFWCVCLIPISVPTGVYMFYFGVPNWILSLFG